MRGPGRAGARGRGRGDGARAFDRARGLRQPRQPVGGSVGGATLRLKGAESDREEVPVRITHASSSPQPRCRGSLSRHFAAQPPAFHAAAFARSLARARELPPPAEPGDESAVRLDLVAAERPTALPCFGGAEPADVDAFRWRVAAGRAAEARRAARGDVQRTACRARASTPRSTGTASACRTIRTACPTSRSSRSGRASDFAYSFVPPDTGTFFFHPHCNTAEQLGRGMAGVLIVEGDESEPYDADVPIVLRDWRIDEAAAPSCRSSRRRAPARPGRSARSAAPTARSNPEIVLPAERRLPAAAPQSRQYARDGDRRRGCRGGDRRDRRHRACRRCRSNPGGSARRCALDIVVRAPADGETVRLVDYFAPEPVPLARLTGQGDAQRDERVRSRAASRRTHRRSPISITPSG